MQNEGVYIRDYAYIRNYYQQFGIAAMVRKLGKESGCTLIRMYQLFPPGPAKGKQIHEIDVAPLSPADDDVRFRLARAIYGHSSLQKYALDPMAPIPIIVENGKVELHGVVLIKADKQIAYVQVRSVPGAFSVTNKLLVASEQPSWPLTRLSAPSIRDARSVADNAVVTCVT